MKDIIQELSISVACMLDDSEDWNDYLRVRTFKQKDVEHLQDGLILLSIANRKETNDKRTTRKI